MRGAIHGNLFCNQGHDICSTVRIQKRVCSVAEVLKACGFLPYDLIHVSHLHDSNWMLVLAHINCFHAGKVGTSRAKRVSGSG